MQVSVAIMAHPKRKKMVPALKEQLPGAKVAWDKKNNRWDTGRRALLNHSKDADWHLVVQDDAILCQNFLAGVHAALAHVPSDVPVSFYTGRTRPYADVIKKAVRSAQADGRAWLALRGPLWGVALALPVPVIRGMVADADKLGIANYDMRMAEWFHDRGTLCWYSLPCLVDHRVGPDNPSLVPERGAGPRRVAHMFCDVDPTTINWATQPVVTGDPTELWEGQDFNCMRCQHRSDDLAGAVTHAYEKHQMGPVDLLASTPHHARKLERLWDKLSPPVRGTFYILGDIGYVPSVPSTRVRRNAASRKLGRGGNYTIVGAFRDLSRIGKRLGWSLDGIAN